MSKNRFFILIFGLIFIALPSKGFDIQSFLMTPDFVKKLTDMKRLEDFRNMMGEIKGEFNDILQEGNINQTIDSLLIKSACEDSSNYVKINERESMLVFFFKNACGMPTIDIEMCDDAIHITNYVELSETNGDYVKSGKVETQEYVRKSQIDILNAWYRDNKRYIKPVFKAYFSDLMSYYLTMQYIYTYTIDPSSGNSYKPNRDPRAYIVGVVSGWKEAIWPTNLWKNTPVTNEFVKRVNGLFKSLISMYYWYKRNELNVLPSDYIIKSGIEMNNQPDQNCSNCREPMLIFY